MCVCVCTYLRVVVVVVVWFVGWAGGGGGGDLVFIYAGDWLSEWVCQSVIERVRKWVN